MDAARQLNPGDPRAEGCRCDVCPLGPQGPLRDADWAPVGPELHEGATVLAVAESPGPDEVREGRPLVGRSGTEWNAALSAIGKARPDVDLFNVIRCRPPGQASGAWSRMGKALDRLNKDRARSGQEPLPHPSTCCSPGLVTRASQYKDIIALGRTALSTLTGRSQSILAARGGPIGVDDGFHLSDSPTPAHRIFPTLHPAFVLRSPGWRHVLHADLAKAFRWFGGTLRWVNPEVLWRPTPDELESWLSVPAPFFAYDVETDGIQATTCGLRTIAIATPDLVGDRAAGPEEDFDQVSRAVGISLLSVDGRSPFYSPADEQRIRALLIGFFVDPSKVKVGHNAGYFDRMVIEHHFWVTPRPLVDTLFSARFRAPDLPKGLKTIGSILTDVERWETTEKGAKISTGSEDDDELLRYNIVDSTVNARIVVPLVHATEHAGAFRQLPPALKPQSWPADLSWDLHSVDHMTQDMCVGLHKNGIWIDQARRQELEKHYEASVLNRQRRLVELAGGMGISSLDISALSHDDDQDSESRFKPGSYDQIRRLLYEDWNLGIPSSLEARDFYTSSGLPGTGDAVLRAHLSGGSLTPSQETFIRELRLFRRERNKVLGTVLRPLQLRSLNPKKGIVWPDGRVRSTWNSHTTSVGRLSSSRMNVQNIGSRRGLGVLKSIFAAPAGRIFVGADLDQAHLRIIANFWKIPRMLDAFTEGVDPHNMLAVDVFGAAFKHASGWGPDGFSLKRKPPSGDAKAMRDCMKTLRYASIYGANPVTVWQVITSTEGGDGKMPYLHMTQREVRMMHKKWLKSEPEWKRAWQRMMATYEVHGCMEEPVLGRRSGALSDGKMNEVVNFPVLAAESSLMRLAEHAVMEAFPFQFQGPGTGMIHQCHDSIAVEVDDPGDEVGREALRRRLEEAMTLAIPGWDVVLTAEAAVGRTLKDV